MVMPVVDTRQFNKRPKKKQWKSRVPIAVALFVMLVAGYLIQTNHTMSPERKSANGAQPRQGEVSERQQSKTGALKEFTGEGFKDLARAVKYPNTQLFVEPPIITGDKIADARIREIAETRGYVLTSIPEASIEKINEPRLADDDLLQPLAAIAWRDLKAAAERDNIPLSLISAYRSPEYQRNLFLGRLSARGVTVARIVAGQADADIEAVLSQAAVPGYSRHHTGYTIDLWCEDGSGAFLTSSCYEWIHADNYKIAKETGWIPSYPEGVELQGPEPEPWEYVWVGKNLVTK